MLQLGLTCPVLIPKNTFSPYGNSDEDSDGPPPSPKKTDATEMKIDKYLHSLLRLCLTLKLFIMDLGFKHQIEKDIVFVLLQNASPLLEKNITLIMIIQCVEQDIFKVLVFFNIVAIRGMIITQQLPFILQHCLKMEWD